MLNRSGESGHLCLVPDFRGNAFSFSPLRIMFAVGLSYIAFIILRYVPSIPAFWRVFFFIIKTSRILWSIFKIYVYLFGCTRSQMLHSGSLIFVEAGELLVVACGI